MSAQNKDLKVQESKLRPTTLDDKYLKKDGDIYLTGVQALVRLPMMQLEKDKARGLNTANFTSGYRGSPLGGLDKAFWQAQKQTKDLPITFQAGLNEDLAATAVWGSQQVNLYQTAKYDGVFGMWYGKGPGVDRSIDAIKHANIAGTSRYGGVLALAGDDHGCKSSTMPHQSEMAFMSALMPVLNPSGVQEFLDLGLLGIEMSRFSGCWTGFKVTGETVESAAIVDLTPERFNFKLPTDFDQPLDGLNIRWPDPPMEQEERHLRYKLQAAQAFVRANHMDRLVVEAKEKRLGIMTTGKAALDVRQALEELDLSQQDIEKYGLSVFKVAMSWPLEPVRSSEFAESHETLLIIEEKQPILERQIKENLYNSTKRPNILGKKGRQGEDLLPEHGELSPAEIAVIIGTEILRYCDDEKLKLRVATLRKFLDRKTPSAKTQRIPYYCSGCPHNTSTKVPEGSRALAGIGCHYMAMWMDRNTETPSQMGGEGVTWIGQSPFTTETHIFSNLGDGTYFHSGILAIRAAVSANVNITYKILFNDAVAMTGGQPVDGTLTVPDLIAQLKAEGVSEITLLSEEPERYKGVSLPAGLTAKHRDQIELEQKRLRDIKGVSVLIYDQTCAAEKRRRRKRGLLEDPKTRIFINDRVCEGCGDCSKQSNCLSIQPLETEFGRKRQIDQSSCNKDLSCIKGFCPSFAVLSGARRKKPDSLSTDHPDHNIENYLKELPQPSYPPLTSPYSLLITGVGGTGVVTIGAILGMAAHLEYKGVSVLDQTGLAQKGGAVTTHLRLAPNPQDIHAVRIAKGRADAILGCDMIVAGSPEALSLMHEDRTKSVINAKPVTTASFTMDPDYTIPEKRVLRRILSACGGDENVSSIEATKLATTLLGDGIATNMFMLGFAWQKGLIPVSAEALMKAIDLNNVAVDMNQRAFNWGRFAAVNPEKVTQIADEIRMGDEQLRPVQHHQILSDWQEIRDHRAEELRLYQNDTYAQKYVSIINKISETEERLFPARTTLRSYAARYLYKLMAYKDEYEVARLYSQKDFKEQLNRTFEPGYKISISLSPALFAGIDPATNRPQKYKFGAWILSLFRIMAKFKGLRGSALDLFGHTEERKQERQWIEDYCEMIDLINSHLCEDNYETAMNILAIPEHIRGYGPVKAHAMSDARENLNILKEAFLKQGTPDETLPHHHQAAE